MLRRNDIVVELDPKGAPRSPYGRVVRRIDATHVEAFFKKYLPKQIEHTDTTNFCNLLHAYNRAVNLVDLLEQAY